MNLDKYRFKMSHMDYNFNVIMIINVILMLVLSGFMSLMCYFFTTDLMGTHWYLFESLDSAGKLSGFAFLSFYLILNSFIPMEIPVMVEFSKFMSTYFLQNDAYMMSPSTHGKAEMRALKVNAMNLHEELGEISYVFCDKTGTLTKNQLIFNYLGVQHSASYLAQNHSHATVLDARSDQLAAARHELTRIQSDENVAQLFRCMNLCQTCIVVP